MMAFCAQCGNVMVLKSQAKGMGTYVCRNCNSMEALPVEKIEIVEKVQMPVAEPLLLIHSKGLF